MIWLYGFGREFVRWQIVTFDRTMMRAGRSLAARIGWAFGTVAPVSVTSGEPLSTGSSTVGPSLSASSAGLVVAVSGPD